MAGVRDDSNAIWLSSITAVINFLVTFVGMWLVEKIGRRPLTLISLSAVSVSSLLIGLGFVVISQSSPGVSTRGETWTACSKYGSCEPCVTDPACGFCFRGKGGEVRNGTCMMAAREDYYTEALSGSCSAKNTRKGMVWAYDYCPTPYFWTVLAGLVLFLFSFAPGLGPMPSTINSEIYPTWARSTGNGVATAVNWTCNLLVSMTFISLTEAITKQGAYFLFAVVGFVFLSVLFLILPETKGKSLEEIEEVFANNVLWWKIRAYVPLKST